MRDENNRTSHLRKARPLRRRMPCLAAAALTLTATVSSVRAVSYYLAVDVPATLGGVDYTPAQILQSDGATYSLAIWSAGRRRSVRGPAPSLRWRVASGFVDPLPPGRHARPGPRRRLHA